MDYVLILFAVACYAAQFAFTKVYEGVVKQTMTTSLVMLVVIGTIGTVLGLCLNGFQLQFSDVSTFLAIIFALATIPYYMIGIKVLSMGSLAIYSMFMMLGGMLVPFAYGVLFLQEALSIGKVLGTVLLTFFIILQALTQKTPGTTDANQKSGEKKLLFFALCMAIFFLNGLTGVIAKVHQMSANAVSEASFTATSCTLTAVFSAILLLISFAKNRQNAYAEAAKTLKYKPVGIIAMISIVQQGGNVLLLMAASNVPASVQFPLVSGGVIVLSALVSVFIFREKLSRIEWIAIAGAFTSTVLFAF